MRSQHTEGAGRDQLGASGCDPPGDGRVQRLDLGGGLGAAPRLGGARRRVPRRGVGAAPGQSVPAPGPPLGLLRGGPDGLRAAPPNDRTGGAAMWSHLRWFPGAVATASNPTSAPGPWPGSTRPVSWWRPGSPRCQRRRSGTCVGPSSTRPSVPRVRGATPVACCDLIATSFHPDHHRSAAIPSTIRSSSISTVFPRRPFVPSRTSAIS